MQKLIQIHLDDFISMMKEFKHAVNVFTKPVCCPRSPLKDRQCKRPVWASALRPTPVPSAPTTEGQLFNSNYVLTKLKMTPIRLNSQAANAPNSTTFQAAVPGMAGGFVRLCCWFSAKGFDQTSVTWGHFGARAVAKCE